MSDRYADNLLKMETACLLQQYLYMSDEHSITVQNPVGYTLILTMDAECNIWCKNTNFKDTPPMMYNEEMTVQRWLIMVDKLSEMPAEEFPQRFKNRLDEIVEITRNNLALNKGAQ